jgi:hypothetical protein
MKTERMMNPVQQVSGASLKRTTMAAKCPYCGFPDISLSRCSECRDGTQKFENLEEHEVNLRKLWRDIAEKRIEDGVDYPRIVITLFNDINRLQARIAVAAHLLDGWEHDAPDLVPDIWYQRMRTALGVTK